MLALDKSEPNLLIRLAVLFHDLGKYSTLSVYDNGQIHFYKHEIASEEIARKVMSELAYPAALIEDVCLLVRHHMFDADPKLTRKGTRKLIERVGKKHIYNLLLVRAADRAGVPETVSMDKINHLKNKIDRELV
jgi:tRNA nucleotidyltransferase (CCA-adding enzyme)